MSSDIPKARGVLRGQIEDLQRSLVIGVTWQDRENAMKKAIRSAEIALSLMTRESVKPHRARVKSDPLDAKLAAQIRRYVRANPAVSTKDAANLFNVNQGRITEALQHKV